jgi:hypothetical protein
VVRVVRGIRPPSSRGILQFLGDQALVNGVAWTAGVMAVGLVKRFFEVKGLRNLWGLMASGSRTPVSAEDYQLIMTLTSYTAGLVMLIVARQLVLRLVAEFHALRSERAQGDGPKHRHAR